MADNLTSATIDVRANTRGLEKDILKALKTVEFSEINTKRSSQALGRITGQVSEFNKSLEASNARVVAFGASAGAIFAVERALGSLISSTTEVEKKLTDINVLLNLSTTQLEKFGGSLFDIARNTSQSFSAVADAAGELARQGLGIEETLKRTNAALILTRLSGMDAKDSVEALTSTLNSFSGTALDAVEVVNKLANVDAAFAVSSADLANAISRVGSTAQDAGVSLDELIALVTSAQQTTARGGSVIGNSFKTIFTRLERGKVQDLLKTLGIDTGEGQSAISLLSQLASVYDTLGAAQKSAVAEQVGGVFQINILRAALADLGKEYSVYGQALKTSLTSTDEAVRRNELLNKTVAALSSQTVTSLQQAADKIGSIVFAPNAKTALSGFNKILESFNNLDSESAGGKLMEGFFTGVGNFISGPGAVLATAVLVKLFAKLSQFASGSVRELLGRNEASKQQVALEQSVLAILQKNSQFTNQILSGKMTTVQAEKQLLDYLTAQSNILREQERLSKSIGANLGRAGVSVGTSGIPMVAATRGKKAAASGFVPNFASDQAIGQAMENAGAKQHGYKAGKAKKTTIHDGNGKSFKSFVNSKEDVKTFTNAAGKKATVVRPPNGFGENTKYAAGGFVPNFAEKRIASVFKSGSSLRGLYDTGPVFDMYNDSAVLKYESLPKKYEEYRKEGRFIFEEARKIYNNSGNDIGKANSYISKRIPGGFSKKLSKEYFDKPFSENAINPIVGALGEKDFFSNNPEFSKLEDYVGPDFKKGDLFAEVKILRKKISEKKLLEKALRGAAYSSPKKTFKNEDRDVISPNLIFASAIKESMSSGFVPNFAKMQDFYKNLKEKEGGADPFGKRASKVNKIAKAGIPVKDLGSLPYTMIHAGGGGNFQSSASFLKKDKKTNQQTQYLGKIWTAGLDQTKLKGANVQKRVGDALVTEANNLSKIFNPSGGSQFSNPNQLSNSGSVFSAAGTVFESAIRGAFNVPAQGQSDRIDFPNPSSELRSFFSNAPGSYEAKIENNDNNRSSALSKYVAVNGLSSGFIPNFVKSGLSFSHKDKDEFGFSEIQAIMSGKKVGSFSYAEDKKGEIDVGDFLVNKSERGKGIGTELYKEAIRRNAGKKMRGQLLPQMNRLLQKIKNGEPVSAETLYPQIKRADLAKSSVFEVYGHKGMTVEKMTRDQFSSFVTAKINELKKDPKKLQSFFGNVEADEYGGLGVDLQTQHASGFVPNFASNILKEKTSGGMGGTNYINKLGDSLNTSIRQNQEGQKYIGIEHVKRAGMLMNGELTPKNKKSGVRSLYGNLFSDAKRSNMPVFSGRIINQAAAKGKSGKTISDNASNLDKMFYAFPQLKSRIDAEKKFKMPTAGTLTALSAPGVDNPVKFFKFKNINELISHVGSLPKIPSSVLPDLTLQDLLTQPGLSAGFVPNFLDVKKDSSLPFGVRGRANFSKPGSRSSIQLGVGATPETLFHEASHLAYSKSTMSKAASNQSIGRFISEPKKYAGVSSIMASSIFKNVNQNELFKSLGLNPVQLDFDGRNPGAKYSGPKAIDEITTRIQEKIFKNKGDLASLSESENAFIKNIEGLGIISNKRMSNVSRRSAEGSKFRSLIEGRFSSAMGGAAGGFVPNLADQVRKNMYDWDGTIIPTIRGGADEYIKQLSSLKEKDLLPIGKKLRAGKKKFDILTSRPPMFEKAISETSSRLSLPVNKINFGVKPKDKIAEAGRRGSKIVDDNLDLIGKPGFLNARVVNKRLSSGFIPNFAAGGRTFNKYASPIGSKTMRVVHPLNPVVNPDGTISFPVMPGKHGNATIFHREAPFGQDKLTVQDFQKIYLQRKKDPRYWERNTFEYINNAGGFIPNFSAALNDAIAREQSSGLSKSQIYVDSHSSLKNKNNPMGLMVANTRDEPGGGIQGIKRAKKEGRNPKTYGGGMSAGFVPNFALFSPDQEDIDALKELDNALKAISEKIKDAAGNFSVSDTENKVKKIEARKARLESAAPNLTSTQIFKSKDDEVAAKQLLLDAKKTGNKSDIDEADKLLAEARKKTAKLESDLRAKIEARVRSLDEQIKAGKDSVVAYKKEQATLLEEKTSIESRRSSQVKEMGFVGRSKKFASNNALSIGFGAQAAGDIASKFAGQESDFAKALSVGTSALGTFASFASTGSLFGPWGTAIGAAVGATVAFTDIIKANNTKLPELTKASEAASEAFNQFSESGQSALGLSEKYAELRNSTDPRAATELIKIQEQYAESLLKLTGAQRDSLVSAIAQGKGQEEFNKISKQLADEQKNQANALSLGAFAEGKGDKKSVQGIGKDLATQIASQSSGLNKQDLSFIEDMMNSVKQSGAGKKFGTESNVAMFSAIKTAIGQSNISEEGKKGLEAALPQLEQLKYNKEFAGEADSFVKTLSKLIDDIKSGKLEEANKSLEENIKRANEAKRKEKDLIDKNNQILIGLSSSLDDASSKMQSAVNSFIENLKFKNEFEQKRGEFKSSFLEQAGAGRAGKSEKLSTDIRAIRGAGVEERAINVAESGKAIADEFMSAIQGLEFDNKAGLAGEELKKAEQDFEFQKRQMQGGVQQAQAGFYQSGGNVEEFKKGLGEISKELTGNITGSELLKLEQVTKKGLDQFVQNQQKQLQNEQQQMALLAQSNAYQAAMSKLTQVQNFGGGASTKDILGGTAEVFNTNKETRARMEAMGQSYKDDRNISRNKKGEYFFQQAPGKWEKPAKGISTDIIQNAKSINDIIGTPVMDTGSKKIAAATQTVGDTIQENLKGLMAGFGYEEDTKNKTFKRSFGQKKNADAERILEQLNSFIPEGQKGKVRAADVIAKTKVDKELGVPEKVKGSLAEKQLESYAKAAFKLPQGATEQEKLNMQELKKAYESVSPDKAVPTLQLAQATAQTGLLTDINKSILEQPANLASEISKSIEAAISNQKVAAQELTIEGIKGKKTELTTEGEGLDKQIDKTKAEIKKIEDESNVTPKSQKILKSLSDRRYNLDSMSGAAMTMSPEDYINKRGAETGMTKFNAANEYEALSQYSKSKGSKDKIAEKNKELADLTSKKSIVDKQIKEQDNKLKVEQGSLENIKSAAIVAQSSGVQAPSAAPPLAQPIVQATEQANKKKELQNLKKTEMDSLMEKYTKRDEAGKITFNPRTGFESSDQQDAFNKEVAQLRKEQSTYTLEKVGGVASTSPAGAAATSVTPPVVSQGVTTAAAAIAQQKSSAGGGVTVAENQGLLQKFGYKQGEGFATSEDESKYKEEIKKLKESKKAQQTGALGQVGAGAVGPISAAQQIAATALPANKPAISTDTKTQQEQNKVQANTQESTNQIISNILQVVQKIATDFEKQAAGGQPGQVTGEGASAGAVNVSAPVSFSINTNNENGAPQVKDSAEKIKTDLAAFLSSPEFVDKVTSIAKQATGDKQPPKQMAK